MPRSDALLPRPPGSVALATLPAVACALAAGAVALSGANVSLFAATQAITVALPDGLWAFVTDQASTASVAAWLSLSLLAWPRAAAAVLLSWPAGLVLVRGLKHLVDAPRPEVLLPPEAIHVIGVSLSGLSFPSGHTATAFAVAAALLLSLTPGRQRRWALPALLLAALVGLSRIAVGAHWPVDVLAGAAIGWLCGLSGAWWSARWRFWERRAGLAVLCALGLLAGVLRMRLDTGYPAAQDFALLLGALAVAVSLGAAWRCRAERS
jgi:membrane-associated phospholipid phosphatase